MVDRRIRREHAARPALLSMSKWVVNDEVEKVRTVNGHIRSYG